MARFAGAAANALAKGLGNAAVGAAGGFAGVQTPGHSVGGAAGTLAGQAARRHVDNIQTGANMATQRQVHATKQYARTGHAAPAAQRLTPQQNAAVQAQIAANMRAQAAAASATPRGGR